MRQLAADPAGGGDATISPDGHQFVTTSRRAGHMDLWIFDLETKVWSQITDHEADDFEARFSPDGQRLVFTSTRAGTKDLWILDLERDGERLRGGEARRLTDSPFEDEYPVFSPDGQQIAYTGGAWGARSFMIVSSKGGEPREIARHGGKVGACGFDPSGDSLVCHNYDLGTGNLLRQWLDGASVPLTLGGAWDYKPMTSGDGRFIAFSRAVEGSSDIWMMPAAGGRPRRLTASPDADRWPTWSADGRRLLFHRLVDRGVRLEIADLETGKIEPLEDAAVLRVGQAAFDSSGERLVYCAEEASGDTSRQVLRLYDRRTGRFETLPLEVADACFPRFLPDGRGVAFTARPKPGRRWEIATASLDGTGLRLLTSGVAGLRGMDGPIDVSPDGRRVVFHADTQAFEANLYLVDLESGALSALTDDAWFDEAPAFSADGTGVVFMSTRGGDWTWGLFERALSEKSTRIFAGPDWVEKNYVRPAGAGHLWTQTTAEGAEQIVRAEVGGEPRVVIDLDEQGRGVRWPSLSVDGRHVLATRVVREVEYWLVENPAGAGSPLDNPAHTPPVALDDLPAAVPVGVAGGGDAAPTATSADITHFVHAAPTPPGGLASVPVGGKAVDPTAADPTAAEPLVRSPVDPFHR